MSSLLEGDIKKHMFRLTLPSIGGMLAIMIYNLTDTYFVSKLGTDELAAMGFTFAVVMMVGAMTMGFSTGATSVISRAIGSGDMKKARRTVSDGLFLTVMVAIIISVSGYFSIIPLFTLLGAKGKVLVLVEKYMTVWFAGAFVTIMPPLSDDCLRAGGDTLRPFYVMMTCAVVNLILDPLLIFGIGPFPEMGIQGAAVATIIARFCGMCASLYFLNFHARLIEWTLPSFSHLMHSWKTIIYLGIPAAFTQALNPVAQAFYMKMASITGGVSAVAALAAGIRIEALIAIFAMAYGIAIIPVVGQNYGAGNHERVDEVRILGIKLSVSYFIGTFILFYFTRYHIVSYFSEKKEVIELCAFYLLVSCTGHSGIYLGNFTSQMLNVVGRPKPVLVFNFFRVFIYIIPAVYTGCTYFGYKGLVIGLVVGNLLSGLHAYFLGKKSFKKFM